MDTKRKFNTKTPSFQPSVQSVTNKFAVLSPKVKEIPVFIPSGMDSSSTRASMPHGQENSPNGQEPHLSRKFNTSTPSFTPSSPYDEAFAFSTSKNVSNDGLLSQYLQNTAPHTPQASLRLMQPATQSAKQQNPYLTNGTTVAAPNNASSVNGVLEYMFHGQNVLAYPLNHHLYAPAPPPRLAPSLQPYETNVNDMFIPNDVRETITKKNEATLQALPQLSLPEHVGMYHSLVPIDSSLDQLSSVYQLPSCVYKVNSNIDGLPYALRRIDYSSKFRILNELPFSTVKKWKKVVNPNVVRLRDAFTSVVFGTSGEPTLCLAYDYFPLANTLQEHHMTRKLGGKLEPVTEKLLWSYLIQLTGALISIHEAGLFAGSSISMSKIIVTNKNRVRLGAVCADDILDHEILERRAEEIGTQRTLKEMQMADITRLGKVITELASATLPLSMRGVPADSIIMYLQSYSSVNFGDEMLTIMRRLMDSDESFDLHEFFGRHLSRQLLELMNGFQDLSDYYESQLLSEVENGRLFRLLVKINFLLDRPEAAGEIGGSMFVISMFRDYLFQTVNDVGKPVIDLSRILVNLNKLDVGIDEKLLLISREEDSCIIVSYKEVKDIIDLSFRSVLK